MIFPIVYKVKNVWNTAAELPKESYFIIYWNKKNIFDNLKELTDKKRNVIAQPT